MHPSSHVVALLVAIVVASFGVVFRGAAKARAPSQVDAIVAPAPLPSWFVRALSLGFEAAAADVSYLQSIQLFGERVPPHTPLEERVRRSDAIARLLDRSTDLDPAFNYAYVFGAVAIPVPTSSGAVRNLAPTESLLRKGIRNVPGDWRLPFHLAYLKTAQEQDFAEGAVQMAEAARRPGAPAYVPLLAIRLAAQGGELQTGIAVAEARLEMASTDEEREEIESRIRLLVMEGHLRDIEAAVERFRQGNGRSPGGVQELVDAGLMASIPAEPHGGAYVIEADGTVRSTGADRLRLPKRALEEFRRMHAPPDQPAAGSAPSGTASPPPEAPKP